MPFFFCGQPGPAGPGISSHLRKGGNSRFCSTKVKYGYTQGLVGGKSSPAWSGLLWLVLLLLHLFHHCGIAATAVYFILFF